MSDAPIAPSPTQPARMKLEPYSAELRLQSLNIGIDNIHFDVFLSPTFAEFARRYLLDLIRQTANVNLFWDHGRKSVAPETAAFKKQLSELLQISLTRAKFTQNIEVDLLNRIAILKFLLGEITNQLSSLIVECKEWIHSRGVHFEHGEQAHVMRARIAELQADRKNIFRQVGQTLFQIIRDLDDTTLAKARRALFGDDYSAMYDLLKNRLLFVEDGSDELIFLEHYVLLGNFSRDPDRFEIFDELLLGLVREFVLVDDNAEELSRTQQSYEELMEQARSLRSELFRLEEQQEELRRKIEGGGDSFHWPWKRRGSSSEDHTEAGQLRLRIDALEVSLQEVAPSIKSAKQRMEFLTDEYRQRIGNYLNDPENIRRLFDSRSATGEDETTPETRDRLLNEFVHRLEERDLLVHVLAGYETRTIHRDYCPPVHLQQLKKALVLSEDQKRVEQILEQYPARKFSIKRLQDSARMIRRISSEETRATALRFAEDLARLRRDRRNYQHIGGWIERVSLVRSEHSRELSRINNSLYELVLPAEIRKEADAVVSHAVIKADVRGSTGITKDLLARGLNPASHFSMNLHEPVKRLLSRYGAAKVFIEGDAIILAIYETESTRATQHAVAKACVLGREILAATAAYNTRAESSDLPRLELGVGVAFQNSAPSLWMDGDSRIMISKALNLSDRLSSCSKMARRLFAHNPSPFNVFLVQTLMEDAVEDEGEELFVRYNLNGIELNDEGFQKLSRELSLAPMAGTFTLPWGKERVQLFFGELPIANALEPIVVRKGFVRQLLPGGKIGLPGSRPYFEVCTHPRLLEIARQRITEGPPRS
ncbi:MAG: hypothetical protein WA734_08130 [Candidatus Acidiferrales bacterium]